MIHMSLERTLHSLNFRGLIYLISMLAVLTRSGILWARWRFDHFSTISFSLAALLLTVTLLAAVVARDVASGLVWPGILRGCPLVADGVNIVDDVD
jgi:hypothetical protein